MEESVPKTGLISALCIDDDKTAHEILSLFLADSHDIEYAFNGKNALEMIQKKKYSLVFLDINLGRDVMDGLELLRLMRQIPGYEKVPVIALTAYAMIGDKEEFLEAGCDFYISKPFNRSGLMQIISQING